MYLHFLPFLYIGMAYVFEILPRRRQRPRNINNIVADIPDMQGPKASLTCHVIDLLWPEFSNYTPERLMFSEQNDSQFADISDVLSEKIFFFFHFYSIFLTLWSELYMLMLMHWSNVFLALIPRDDGQHWIRWWHTAWWNQAITWTLTYHQCGPW